jgi:hypothetical protein
MRLAEGAPALRMRLAEGAPALRMRLAEGAPALRMRLAAGAMPLRPQAMDYSPTGSLADRSPGPSLNPLILQVQTSAPLLVLDHRSG